MINPAEPFYELEYASSKLRLASPSGIEIGMVLSGYYQAIQKGIVKWTRASHLGIRIEMVSRSRCYQAIRLVL